MEFRTGKQNHSPKQGENQQPAEEYKQGEPSFDSPNSRMLSEPLLSPGTPNSVMREMLDPRLSSAEEEADRLSAGITSGTPDSVRREMGSRLGSDFSSVHFHSGPDSIRKNEDFASRAYTQRNEVYFGRGGFEARVAAHELVHTVQQGAARGYVRQSVTPGTVQMWSWWPFGKKESAYDKERTPADFADSLVRIQAGFSASEEREKAQRDAQYAKTYDREMKRINKANRNKIRERGSEKQDRENARNAAEQSAGNLRTEKKDYVSKDDKSYYDRKILTISRDTYKELIDRRIEAAVELSGFFNEINRNGDESADKQAYTAANSTFGKKFKLYDKLIQNIEQLHENDEIFLSWKNEVQQEHGRKNETVAQSKLIIAAGTSNNNTYLKSEKGIRERVGTEQDNKEFYKKFYKKKKTKLDRMAAVYRRRNHGRTDLLSGLKNDKQPLDLISEESAHSGSSGMEDSSEMIHVEGLSEIDKQDTPESGKEKPANIISGKPVGNDDDSDSGTIGENIISANKKDPDKEEDEISNGALRSKVQDYIASHSEEDDYEEDLINRNDSNQIIRTQAGVTDELVDQFVPKNKVVNDVKERNKKGKFVGSIAKGLDNLGQLGLAVYNQNMLNSKNVNTDYIHPSFSAVTSGIGTLTGLAGTVTGAADTWRHFRNTSAGGSRMNAVTSGMDTLASLGNTASSGLSAMKNMGKVPMIGETLKNASKFGGADMIPGLNVATGGITFLTGAYKGIRGQSSINTIDELIDENNTTKYRGLEKDQEKLSKIFKQSRRVAELHRTSGAMKAAGGAITMGTGIALLTGPLAPVTAAVLGATGAGVGITNFVYSKRKKINLRKDITAEEMGFKNWAEEIKKVKAHFPRENLSDAEAKEIIFKSHGFDVKTRAQAFKHINLERAQTLLDIAQGIGPLKSLAEKVIGALGVKRRKGRYAGGAQKLLAEKLGGS